MRRWRLAGWGLLPAGMISGHAASYLLAGRPPHGGVHDYLDLACWPAALLALGALAWFAGSTRRARWIPGSVPFAAVQVGVFVVQETVEGLVDGRNLAASLLTATVGYGVAAQLVLGMAAVLLARLAVAAGARLRTVLWPGWPRCPKSPAILPAASASRWVGRLVVSPASERGPPPLLSCF
ncbi:MAG: hypothetical protein ACRDY7_17425 [Acidimicrobiia bacterium]